MSREVVIVGTSGKMSKTLQEVLSQRKQNFKILSPRAPEELKSHSLKGMKGVLDFSTPEVARVVLQAAASAGIPYVCGTTGFQSAEEWQVRLRAAAKKISVVYDANFSQGIEALANCGVLLAQKLRRPVSILDIHHAHKKDAPSGTALQLQNRIQAEDVEVTVTSIRIGEVFGEHRILLSWNDEILELSHRAHSRKPFALGALEALEWVQKKRPGLYSMKDILK